MGTETVNDERAYKVRLTLASGTIHYNYYSMNNHLKLKTEIMQEGLKNEFVASKLYSNYKEVNGVKLPFKIQYEIPGSRIMIQEVKEYKINKGIKDSVFQFY
jgi:hypothetical protein